MSSPSEGSLPTGRGKGKKVQAKVELAPRKFPKRAVRNKRPDYFQSGEGEASPSSSATTRPSLQARRPQKQPLAQKVKQRGESTESLQTKGRKRKNEGGEDEGEREGNGAPSGYSGGYGDYYKVEDEGPGYYRYGHYYDGPYDYSRGYHYGYDRYYEDDEDEFC